jgi:rfaE bifunctional protein nucleotidyltransferase chain/domain
VNAHPPAAGRSDIHLVVVGDTLLDADLDGSVTRLCPDAPVPVVDAGSTRYRPGGAGLAAVLAATHGRTTLITALARDDDGDRLAAMLDAAGVAVIDLGAGGTTPQKLRVMVGDRSLLRIDRGEAAKLATDLPAAAGPALAGADGVLVADYGRGVAGHAALRRHLATQARYRPLVWDPHPRGPEPVRGAWLVTPNESEAAQAARSAGIDPAAVGADVAGATHDAAAGTATAGATEPATLAGPVDRSGRFGPHTAAVAEALRRRWACRAVTITCGARGALLWGGAGAPLVVQPSPSRESDACGAGDCFAVAALAALCRGRTTSEAVEAAVETAARFVAEGGPARALDPSPLGGAPTGAGGADGATGASGGGAPDPAATGPAGGVGGAPGAGGGVLALAEAADRVRAARAAGGVVVATSGCFDLLHPGHIHVLDQARRLGDLLVVLVNSDASVRRLKGSSRPIQPEADRAAVLAALEAVDIVVVFGEDTPAEALGALRPDLFAKGGDYFGADLPEAAVMAALGGQAVVVPYLAGRSTTRLVTEASRAG